MIVYTIKTSAIRWLKAKYITITRKGHLKAMQWVNKFNCKIFNTFISYKFFLISSKIIDILAHDPLGFCIWMYYSFNPHTQN